MANQLDLEEQEQLDQLKHFWKQYGNAITWALIIVLTLFAGWNGYRLWQNRQSTQAAALFDEVERAIESGDATKLDRVLSEMKERFSSSAYAGQAALLVAARYAQLDKRDSAKAALSWVSETSTDAGYQALARLRLAGLLIDGKELDAALSVLGGVFPAEFEGLVADRKGDVLKLKGDAGLALDQYKKAYRLLTPMDEYRRLIEVKLGALGVDVQMLEQATQVAGK